MKIKQQAINLEIDFILKERENIVVLKELEMKKRIANDLKLQLPKETSKSIQVADRINSDFLKLRLNPDAEKTRPNYLQKCASSVVLTTSVRKSPSLILMELQQAKMNLARSTCGISGIRASVEQLKSMIAKEEAMLEKSRERLRLDTAKVLTLEENLKKSTAELKLIQDAQSRHHKTSEGVSKRITELGLEKEGFKMIAEVAKADAARLISGIDHMKTCIKAAEAAQVALVAEKVTLSFEEYTQLICKGRQSDEKSKKTIEAAMARVREASQSNHSLHMKIEEAIAEAGASRKALKEAQKREEVANREKLAAEEALEIWLSKQKNNMNAMATTAVESNREMLKEELEREELENSGKLSGDEDLPWWTIKQKQKTRSVQNSTKFKNSNAVPHRTETRILDVNGMSLATTGRPRRLSIGQILTIKLMDTEEYEKGIGERAIERPRISLGQLLSQRHELMSPTRTNVNNACTKFSRKRKMFGFICLSLILAKQNKRGKNRRRAWSLQSNCRALVM
ncbi:WEB family protein [Dendrobium catenatum]|uniref:WEB family protein n=1 Tax=Dendrobium catenatum TaxID=906689 RepID=A0A2I0W6S0_9ASPA|nr:WEB family protein [Dendrobium catenatum]